MKEIIGNNMKMQEELHQLKTEYETLNNKLKELSDDELNEVIGDNETPEQGSTKYTKYPIYISVHHAWCYLISKVQETIESQYSCSKSPKRYLLYLFDRKVNEHNHSI